MFIKNEDYIIREENEFYLAYNYIAHTYYQLNEIAIIVISEAAKMVLRQYRTEKSAKYRRV